MFKWTPETLIAAAAIVLSTGGGITTTAIHWGKTDQKIAQVEQNQTNMNVKLDQHQAELAAQNSHEAAVEQKLDDMIERLDRIEKKL